MDWYIIFMMMMMMMMMVGDRKNHGRKEGVPAPQMIPT